MARFVVLLALLVIYITIIDAATTANPGNTNATTTGKPEKSDKPKHHKKKTGFKKPSHEEKKKHPQYHLHKKVRGAAVLPDSFDARVKWPQCKSISDIRDQGQCGTCWAVSSASVLSDRICISSNGTIQDYISALDIASCQNPSQSPEDNCNAGGDPANAYKMASTQGIVSGGTFQSNVGCQPYPVDPAGSAIPLTCSSTCTNSGFSKAFPQDLHTIDSYWTTYSTDDIQANIVQMKTEIMTNGPITAAIDCYDDLQPWTLSQGPYPGPGAGANNEGGHAIRLIGWGPDYWLVANSWGTSVGDKGTYRIKLGSNVVGIEGTISAPIIKMQNTCPSMCGAAFDQVLRFDPTNANSPIYAFQGNCVVQITIASDGTITQVGKPAPTGSIFVGAPPGPITKYMINGGQLWIMNPSGTAGACSAAVGSTIKYQCSQGTAQSGAGPTTVNPTTNDKYVYYNDPSKNTYMFKFAGGSNSGSGTDIGTSVTGSFPNGVTSLQDIDGSSMLICGGDQSGNNICGVMSYANLGTWTTTPSALLKC